MPNHSHSPPSPFVASTVVPRTGAMTSATRHIATIQRQEKTTISQTSFPSINSTNNHNPDHYIAGMTPRHSSEAVLAVPIDHTSIQTTHTVRRPSDDSNGNESDSQAEIESILASFPVLNAKRFYYCPIPTLIMKATTKNYAIIHPSILA